MLDDLSNKACNLKRVFVEITNDRLDVNCDQLFLKNESIRDFLGSNFDHLFSVDDDTHVTFEPFLKFSVTSAESLDDYIKAWGVRYDRLKLVKREVEEKMLKMLYKLREPLLFLLVVLSNEYKRSNSRFPSHKMLRSLVKGRMKSLLCVGERQERRYWTGTWRLIELLHLTQCLANVLVKSGITPNYLMTATGDDYDRFLKDLLDDVDVFHKPPVFDELIMREVIEFIGEVDASM